MACYLLEVRRFGPFLGITVVSMMCKEEVSAMVFMLGLYMFLVLGLRLRGTVLALLGAGWFVVCTRIILPHFNGLAMSPFLNRLAIFGPTLEDSLISAARDPLLVLRWLARPEISGYLAGLLASGGFLSLLAPQVLALSAPVVALNVFSNWPWTFSEGAHYSATVIPVIVVSSIYGAGWLARQLQRRRRWPYARTATALAALALAVGIAHHVQVSVSPLARTFHPPHVDDHDRLGAQIIAQIPREAAVSAQSNLYPHLANRAKAYFFPAVNDAEYVLLDVTSPSYPIKVGTLHREALQLLRSGHFGVRLAQDGYLLLERGAPRSGSGEMPPAFYDFASSSEASIEHPMRVRFGDDLELLGYGVTYWNLVHAHELPVRIKTYWRPLRPLTVDLQFAWFFTRDDGAIVYGYDEGTATTEWWPTSRWPAGEVFAVETPILNVGRLADVLIAVAPPQGDLWASQGRFPVELLDAPGAELRAASTLLHLFEFSQ
jgi:hypothetical protein